jgi:hypothetical protein
MGTVKCTVEEIVLEGDYGEIASVEVTCSKCNHTTQSYGTHRASIRRCLVLLREECPCREDNYYVDEDGDDDD